MLHLVRPKKYGNQFAGVGNMVFASKLEARRYAELLLMVKAGEISNLRVQVPFELQSGFTYRGSKIRAIHYIADFVYWEERGGENVIEETKGFQTEASKIKMKMLKYQYPEYRVDMVYAKVKPKQIRKRRMID